MVDGLARDNRKSLGKHAKMPHIKGSRSSLPTGSRHISQVRKGSNVNTKNDISGIQLPLNTPNMQSTNKRVYKFQRIINEQIRSRVQSSLESSLAGTSMIPFTYPEAWGALKFQG